jgi:hypothetical protein
MYKEHFDLLLKYLNNNSFKYLIIDFEKRNINIDDLINFLIKLKTIKNIIIKNTNSLLIREKEIIKEIIKLNKFNKIICSKSFTCIRLSKLKINFNNNNTLKRIKLGNINSNKDVEILLPLKNTINMLNFHKNFYSYQNLDSFENLKKLKINNIFKINEKFYHNIKQLSLDFMIMEEDEIKNFNNIINESLI